MVTEPARSTGLWLEHPRRKISFVLPGSNQCPKIRRGLQPKRIARGLPARMPRRGSDRRPYRHQDPAALPRRLCTHLARAPAAGQDPTGPTYVGSLPATFKAPTCAPASNGSCATARSSRGRVSVSTYGASPSPAPSSPARPTTTPSQRSRTARRARPSSTGSGAACLAQLTSSSTSQAITPTARRRLPRRLTLLRVRGSKRGPR
jgi:hypothetical protein